MTSVLVSCRCEGDSRSEEGLLCLHCISLQDDCSLLAAEMDLPAVGHQAPLGVQFIWPEIA